VRVTKACELYSQSEAGKMIMREAIQHWDITKVLCAMVLWMNQAQVSLIQQCLVYSGKMHWHMAAIKKCFTSWRWMASPPGSAMHAERRSMAEFKKKARRLSLQSDRCSQKLKERRLSCHFEPRHYGAPPGSPLSRSAYPVVNVASSPVPMSPIPLVA